MPWCKPSRTNGLPFSSSQNVIVPYLGLRLGPLHQALPDTRFDEAVTITALLRGLNEWYASVSTADPSGAAAPSGAAVAAPRHAVAPMAPASTNILSNANAAFAAAFRSARPSTPGPVVKKQKTDEKAVSKKQEAKSLPSVASFFKNLS
eukprot:6629011-Prymnesium_polylepis.2